MVGGIVVLNMELNSLCPIRKCIHNSLGILC